MDEIQQLEERMAGLALHLVVAGIPLEPIDRYTHLVTSRGSMSRRSVTYRRLLAGAVADLVEAAVEHGYAPEVVGKWPSIPLRIAVGVCNLLLKDGDVR